MRTPRHSNYPKTLIQDTLALLPTRTPDPGVGGLEWPAATCADPGGASIDQESEAEASNLKHGTGNLTRWNEHSCGLEPKT